MTDHSPDHAERAAIDLKIEQWREVAALEDRNMRTSGSVIRLWAEETASLLAALRGRDAVGEALEKIAAFESQPIRGTVSEQSASLGWNRAGEWAARVAASALATRAALHDATVRGEGENG